MARAVAAILADMAALQRELAEALGLAKRRAQQLRSPRPPFRPPRGPVDRLTEARADLELLKAGVVLGGGSDGRGR